MLREDVFIHSPYLRPKKIFFGGALSQSLKLSEKGIPRLPPRILKGNYDSYPALALGKNTGNYVNIPYMVVP